MQYNAGATSTTGMHVGNLIVQNLEPVATLSAGPTTGACLYQSTAFTVTLSGPAGYGGAFITPASSVIGDTFQTSPGGGNITTLTIPEGSTSGTFYLIPNNRHGSKTPVFG